jgi:hypothetical protein
VKVAIGQVNETHAQIASGVSQGQDVLILQAGQGRDLLEKAGIKVEPQASTTQPLNGRPPRVAASDQPVPDGAKGRHGANETAGAMPGPKPGATPTPSAVPVVANGDADNAAGGTKARSASNNPGRRSKSDSPIPGQRPPR